MRTPSGSRRRSATSRSASSSETFTPSTFATLLVDDREQRVAGGVEVVVAPVAGERRVERRGRASAGSPAARARRARGRRSRRSPPGAAPRRRARGSPSGSPARRCPRRTRTAPRTRRGRPRGRGRGDGVRWSVPAPAAIVPPTARASPTLRRISSRLTAQSSPMPRWAVSIASATANPCSHRWRRKASVASQSSCAGPSGSPAASGSATTWAAANATRLRGGPAGGP